ncbi:MAG TPA: ATP-grasp domain-containing protein [Bacillota bacterium]|nr:ATP-grasp domain-containing protein [Bacillota bacterium]
MLIWLIYSKEEASRNKHYITMYFDECNRRDIELILVYREDIEIGIRNGKPFVLYQGIEQDRPDFVICRIIDSLLTKHLEILGLKVFNSYRVSSICNDKQQTYQFVSKGGIKIMDTIFTNKAYWDDMPYPAVIKPAHGRGGNNVYLVKNEDEYRAAMRQMPDFDIIIQKVASDIGRDLRVYVIGKRIIVAILRVSDTDFRSNFSLGGSAQVYTLSGNERQLIYKIIDMFDFGLVGIDFVFDKGELVFNEIEDVVGSRMLYAKTDINIVSEYLDYMIKSTKASVKA